MTGLGAPNARRALSVIALVVCLALPVAVSRDAVHAPQALAQTANCPMSIAAGWLHSLAMKCNDSVWAWGYNNEGQLGNRSTLGSGTPVRASRLTNVRKVAAGASHSLAVTADGTVWAWGSNSSGQLGNGTTTNATFPVQVPNLAGVTSVAAGPTGTHSLALTSSGVVWAWGSNSTGELGNGTTADSLVPVQVSGLTGVVAIAAGDQHSLALKSDGSVWGWGYNFYGQVGVPAFQCQNGTCSTSPRLTPVQVQGLGGVSAIAAGSLHSLAVKSDGTAWAWGRNDEGELGDGTTSSSSSPRRVADLTTVSRIAGGGYHSLALKSDGTAWAWGYNAQGQLGTGTTGTSLRPARVSGLPAVVYLAGGRNHSLAARDDGTVWGWGANGYGQLGNGGGLDSSSPVELPPCRTDFTCDFDNNFARVFTTTGSGYEVRDSATRATVGLSGASALKFFAADVGGTSPAITLTPTGASAQLLGSIRQDSPDTLRSVSLDAQWTRFYRAQPGGIGTFDVLQSPLAPTEFRTSVALAPGWQLSLQPDSSITITDGAGQARGHIAAVSATDLVGTRVPTSVSIEGGNTIVARVSHGLSYVYPVEVDPYHYVGGFIEDDYRWRQETQHLKHGTYNPQTGQVEVDADVRVDLRVNAVGLYSNNAQVIIDLSLAYRAPGRDDTFGAYIKIQCKRNIAGQKDPKCSSSLGSDEYYIYDEPDDYRQRFTFSPYIRLENLPPPGERRKYFYEVLVKPFVSDGQNGDLEPDAGKYRTYDLTCTSDGCFFDRNEETGKGG